MTQLYVYRGVTYKKENNENITVKNTRIEKIYRGARYVKLPKKQAAVTDHVYRGVQFAV